MKSFIEQVAASPASCKSPVTCKKSTTCCLLYTHQHSFHTYLQSLLWIKQQQFQEVGNKWCSSPQIILLTTEDGRSSSCNCKCNEAALRVIICMLNPSLSYVPPSPPSPQPSSYSWQYQSNSKTHTSAKTVFMWPNFVLQKSLCCSNHPVSCVPRGTNSFHRSICPIVPHRSIFTQLPTSDV